MLPLVLGLTFAAAAEPSKPVLMVVYFDNLTGKPEHDVMKKGLADMIITDLIAYDGVTVVESDKLEAVLGELHLQGTRAFDPETRAKVGKLVGARYLISGSMLGVMPEVRIDARLTDIRCSRPRPQGMASVSWRARCGASTSFRTAPNQMAQIPMTGITADARAVRSVMVCAAGPTRPPGA